MNSTTMTREEGDAKNAELQKLNQELQKSMQERSAEFSKAMTAAIAERQRIRDEKRAQRDREREARQQQPDNNGNVAVTETTAAPEPQKMIRIQHALTNAEKEMIRQRARQVQLLLGHDFAVPVESDGRVVGHVAAQVSPDEVIRRVLGTPNEGEEEIAFAIDREGHFYTRSDSDRKKLETIGVPQRIAAKKPLNDIANWIVVTSNTAGGNGLRVGVARRVGEDLEELRRTAGHNFGYGLLLVFVALIGIVPMTNHMTRDVAAIAQGAERVAQGDLQTRVPVRSKNEFGQLAVAFNKMAHDLSEHQQRLVEQKILAVEYERKAADLEEARRFQLSMLPKQVPQLDRFDVAVFTQTATEVGGDYYDFHVDDGTLTVTIGDATGHGAKAGTMVTVIKTLFAGYSASMPPASFLGSAAEKIKRMDLGRMAMALSLARFDGDTLTIASA